MNRHSWMRVLLASACLTSVHCGATPPPPPRSPPPAADADCASLTRGISTNSEAFLLIFDAASGAWRRPADPSGYVLDTQRVIVCIDHPDHRDHYEVTVGPSGRDTPPSTEPTSGEVGTATPQVVERSILSATMNASLAERGTLTQRVLAATAAQRLDLARAEQARLRGIAQALCGILFASPHNSITDLAAIRGACAGDPSRISQTDGGPWTLPHVLRLAYASQQLLEPLTDDQIGMQLVSLQQVESVLDDLRRQLILEPMLQAAEHLESERVAALRSLLEAYQAPLHAREVEVLRQTFDGLLQGPPGQSPNTTVDAGPVGGPPHAPHGPPTLVVHAPYAPGTPVPRAFEEHINHDYLPQWIWYTNGELRLFMPRLPDGEDGGTTPSLAAAEVQSANSVMLTLTTSISRTWRLIEFTQDVLASTTHPRRVFDLGRFSGGTSLTLHVNRLRRTLHLNQGTLQVRSHAADLVHTEVVHDLSQFRVEPGLAMSTASSPDFSLGTNPTGDTVLQRNTPFSNQLFPTVFIHFSFCPVDLRSAPGLRRCNRSGVMDASFLSMLAHTLSSNVGLSLGITPSEAIFRNLFVGLNFQPFSYMTFVFGAHLGSARSLAPGFEVGDRYHGELAAAVQEGFRVSPFVAISLGQDAWTQLRGLHPQ